MDDDEDVPGRNDPMGPVYPSETPALPGNGFPPKWLVILVLGLGLLSMAFGFVWTFW